MQGSLTFAQAVWLLPAAVVLHFAEEMPRFPAWAAKHASARYTPSHWRRVHGLGLLLTVAGALAVSRIPTDAVTWLFFALLVAPMAWNAVFHAGASALTRSYCPGVITAVLLFPALLSYLARLAIEEGRLTFGSLGVALTLALALHAADVATTVFFVTPGPSSLWSVRSSAAQGEQRNFRR